MRDCLGPDEQSEKVSQKNSRKAFFLNYGESGIEYFNVLSKAEMERINKLAQCVQQRKESSTSSISTQSDSNATSTVLTGLLQTLLPKETGKVMRAIRQALADADWVDKAPYGIRHATLW
ncbi:hypothetical protein EON65_54270, partial [archaeon]